MSVRSPTEKAAEIETWECPVCGAVFTYGGQCKHMYFDSHTYVGPLLKRKYSSYKDIHQAQFAILKELWLRMFGPDDDVLEEQLPEDMSTFDKIYKVMDIIQKDSL